MARFVAPSTTVPVIVTTLTSGGGEGVTTGLGLALNGGGTLAVGLAEGAGEATGGWLGIGVGAWGKYCGPPIFTPATVEPHPAKTVAANKVAKPDKRNETKRAPFSATS